MPQRALYSVTRDYNNMSQQSIFSKFSGDLRGNIVFGLTQLEILYDIHPGISFSLIFLALLREQRHQNTLSLPISFRQRDILS